MTEHHQDPLTEAIKDHPIGYFVVMCLLGLAAGTLLFDLAEVVDSSIVPTAKLPRYVAAVFFAFGAHHGLAWRRKKRA